MPAVKFESYGRPPITEAVIGINFSENVGKELLLTASDRLGKHYPVHQPLKNLSIRLNLTDQPGKRPSAVSNLAEIRGHRRSSHDMSELALVLPDALVVSQLAPYPSWEVFSKRFVRDWRIWKRAVGHRTVSRIGVRYINRIDIPIVNSVAEHQRYLNVFPHVPDLLSPLGAFAVQTISSFDDIKCRLTLNSAVIDSPILNHQSFILDLDIAREIDIPQADKDIFLLLEAIRLKKNQVFEACISQRARDEIFRGAKDAE